MNNRLKMTFIGFFIFERVLVKEIFLNPVDVKLREGFDRKCMNNFYILGGTLEYFFLTVFRKMYTRMDNENNSIDIEEFHSDDLFNVKHIKIFEYEKVA